VPKVLPVITSSHCDVFFKKLISIFWGILQYALVDQFGAQHVQHDIVQCDFIACVHLKRRLHRLLIDVVFITS